MYPVARARPPVILPPSSTASNTRTVRAKVRAHEVAKIATAAIFTTVLLYTAVPAQRLEDKWLIPIAQPILLFLMMMVMMMM